MTLRGGVGRVVHALVDPGAMFFFSSDENIANYLRLLLSPSRVSPEGLQGDHEGHVREVPQDLAGQPAADRRLPGHHGGVHVRVSYQVNHCSKYFRHRSPRCRNLLTVRRGERRAGAGIDVDGFAKIRDAIDKVEYTV